MVGGSRFTDQLTVKCLNYRIMCIGTTRINNLNTTKTTILIEPEYIKKDGMDYFISLN